MWPSWLRAFGQRKANPHASPRRAPPVRAPVRPRAVFEELEPRLLYSADSPGAWLPSAVLPAAVVQVVPPVQPTQAAVDAAQTTPSTTSRAAAAQAPHELVFIDAAVVHTQALMDGLLAARPSGTALQFITLQAGSDGLQQINAVLAQHSGVSAVHIVAHGEQAALQLGSTRLDAAALQSRSGDLQAWRQALASDADLLLYGCDVAAGDSGAAFVQQLARLTGADVAASTNATGAAAAGGDWVLELEQGRVTAQAAWQPLQQALQGTLSLVPQGAEARVNSDATDVQNTSQYGGGSVAMDNSGNAVVVWTDARTNSGDIYFQRYNAAGVAQGGNVLVNSTTSGSQTDANVAMDPTTGSFVVVWSSDGQDGDQWGVYGQRFTNTGIANGAEFRVNTTTANTQNLAAVAMAPGGAFVVTWANASGGDAEVVAQRFDAGGAKQGGEIAVNTTSANTQSFSSVAMDAAGKFVVLWESNAGSDYNIQGRRFDAAGVALGGEFQVNTTGSNTQWNAAVAADSAGNFVAVWESAGQDPDASTGVYGQRYNASGVAQGAEFRVNTTNANAQSVPAVAMDNSSGSFVVSWLSDQQDGSVGGVYARAFDAAANPLGGEVLVPTTTANQQSIPSVAVAGDQVVVVWSGEGVGDLQGVFARQLQLTNYGQVVVDTTSDVDDGDTSSIDALSSNKGADGFISLREAITAANNTTNGVGGPDRIYFDIAGAGPHVVTLASVLPNITQAVLIDGSTEPDFAANGNRPVVVIDGNSLGVNGLVLAAGSGGSTLRGLVVRDFGNDAIQLLAGSNGNTIVGNYIGRFNTSGGDAGAAEANVGVGLLINSANNLVGGATAADRNVISGNSNGVHIEGAGATGNRVSGNRIGTDAAGTLDLGNSLNGIALYTSAANNVLGTNLDGSNDANEGNLISGNDDNGVQLLGAGTGNVLRGNLIGVNASATAVLGNATQGIQILGATTGTVVGGTSALAANVVGGSAFRGIEISGAGSTGNLVQGNFVGTNSGGVLSLPNAVGIGVVLGAASNTIGGAAAGSGNVVAYNTGAGISVSGSGANNSFLRNLVQGNGLLGIDLGSAGLTANDLADADTGANDLQNFPVLASANSNGGNTTITGNFNSNASTNYRIEFFSSPVADGSGHGEGAVYLGSTNVSTSIFGTAFIGVMLSGVSVSTGHAVSATATVDLGGGNYGSTSEFAATLSATGSAPSISASAISGNTSEAGGSATFTVVLGTAPLADVQVPVASSNPLEGSVNTALLTFTSANWATPQTVTVTGLDDTLDDGDRAFSVLLGAATSADADYSGMNPADVAASNTDNDNQNTVLVTTTSDTADGDSSSLYALLADPGADGQVSLREAITATNNTANGSGGVDRIHFNMAGAGPHVITPATALPNITQAVLIDGSTEPDFAGNGNRPVVVLDGNNLAAAGLTLAGGSGGSTVRGLVIRDFGTDGLAVLAGSDGNTIVGNYIGRLDTSGADAGATEANGSSGIYVQTANNVIGGTALVDRNVISGNAGSAVGFYGAGASGNVVAGNFIGLAADGASLLGNGASGVRLLDGASNNTIGGATAAHRNVISGNGADGVQMGGSGNSAGNDVRGNYIGTDSSGTLDRGNTDGVKVQNTADNNRIIGNLIAGNSGHGVDLGQAGASTGALVQGNLIGTQADGTTALANDGHGIRLGGGGTASSSTIGGTAPSHANTIAFNGGDGIFVAAGTGVAMVGNLIHSNAGLAIDIGSDGVTANDAGDADSGANNLQNFPVLATARTDGSGQLTLTGTMNGVASTDYRIDFYANAAGDASSHGEGQRYLGYINVTTDAGGLATLSASLAVTVAAGEAVSATATSANPTFTVFSDTSEFALNLPATLAPVLSTSGSTLAVAENDPAAAVDAALAVSDGDSVNLVGATVSISANFASGQDVLQFTDQLGITGSWNAGTGVLTLSGNALVADYQTALRSVTYSNTSDAPSVLARTVSFVVDDGVAPGAAATRSISVTAVNDAPTVSASGSTLAVAENSAATPVDAGLLLADVDSGSLSSASVSISAAYVNGQDLLLFTDQLGITGSWNAGTGVLTLSGSASVPNYQTALRSVSYLNNSEAPDVTLRTLSFDVNDGALTSTVATRALQVTAVNDAPVLDNSAAMLLTTIARTNTTNPGNTVAQVIGSVSGNRITDADTAALEGVAITTTATAGLGAWEYSLDGGGTWQAVGVVANNAALLLRDTDHIRFVPSGAGNGQASFSFRAWDQSSGAVGSTVDASTAGGLQPFSSALETATIDVVENTGGPVAVDDMAQTQVGVAVAVNVTTNDLDPQGDPLALLDVSNPTNGTLALAGNTITYTPNGGFSGPDSFNYVVTDGNEGLTHYWKLDGDAVDSVAGSNGTLVNGPSTVAGAYGSALQFDGVDDHGVLPDPTYTNEFSLSFRFRVDDNSGSQIQYFYSHGPLPNSGFGGQVHVGLVEASNAVFAQRNNLITTVFDSNDATDGSGQLLVDVASLIGDGQWHQYTATVTPGIGTRVYVDGVLRGSVDRGGDALDATGSAYLGARSDLDPTRYLNSGGRMDSLALFNRALSAAEVADFWTGGSAMATVTVDVNAVPVVATSGGPTSYTENAAATAVDSGLTVADANNANLAGAVVSISSNYLAGQDQLQFSNQLGITGSWNVGTGELTLSGNASVANYQAALRTVAYVNSSDAPSTLTRGVQFVVNDGVANSVVVAQNITVSAVNDAPTAAGLNSAESFTEDAPLNLVDIVISDADSVSGSATLVLSDATAGALSTGTSGAVTASYNAGTGVWTASGALVDLNSLLSSVTFTPALNFNGAFSISTSVSDGVAAPTTGGKSFTGVAVNDAPTASNLNTAQNYTEDTPLALVPTVVADGDSATVTATLTLSDAAAGSLNTGTSGAVASSYGVGSGVWSASGAVADVNNLLAALTFTPAANYTSAFSINTSISDGVAAPVTGSRSLSVTLVNDAPTASNLNAAENYTEDLPLNLVDVLVSDVDSATVTATLSLSDTAAGAFSVATAGAVTSTFNPATGVWQASGALADVNTLLAALVFTPAAHFNGGFSLGTSVSDGVAAPITGSKVFTATAVNDAPTASNLSAAETYTEDTPLNLTDIVAADVDSTNLTATLTLSDPGAGQLAVGSSGAVTASFNATTGVWSASGATADVNALLAALTFTPALNHTGPFTLATQVHDGVAAPITGFKNFSALPVNDAPTATGLNSAESYTEDTPLLLAPVVLSDVDSATGSATLVLSNPALGSLSTGSAGAATSTFNAATGVWTASGALVDVNALLAAVQFVPVPNFNGSFSISTSVSDGVAAPLQGLKAFTGLAVNDAPTATGLSTPHTYTEDTPLSLSAIVLSDGDSATVSATLTLSDVGAGSLAATASHHSAAVSSFDAATGVWTASGTVADVNQLLAALRFTPTPHFNASFTVATQVSDGLAAPVGGSHVFTGVAVNDVPVLTVNTGLQVQEGSAAPLTAAQLRATDVDHSAAELVYTLVNAPAHGWLQRGGAQLTPGTGFTQAELDAGQVVYHHDGSETTADAFDLNLADVLGAQAQGAPLQVQLAVAPVNDETPQITSPLAAATGAAVPVPENTRAVTVVSASDGDLPQQTLQFQIAGGADAALFSIDARSGELQFISAPDFEQPLDADRDNLYQLDLRVDDGLLSSTHRVTVAVTPLNDLAPQMVSGGGLASAGVEVLEGGAAVFTVLASDADRPAGTLLYSISGGADAALFAIEASSGALRFVAPPAAADPRDSNRDNRYDVVVRASDGAFTVQQTLQVLVRAAELPGLPGLPETPTAPTGSSAPTPYTGEPEAPKAAPSGLPLQEVAAAPSSQAVAEEPGLPQGLNDTARTGRGFKLLDQGGVRSASDALPEAQAAWAQGSDTAGNSLGATPGAYGLAPDSDTPSLEAALGLPTVDPGLLQVRPGGLSLAALAAQAAARSSTAVPSGLSPAGLAGEGGAGDEGDNAVISAIATPVVAGGLAFSATLLVWATRAGGLMAAMMASVPAWRSLDPLPILERNQAAADDDDLPDAAREEDLGADGWLSAPGSAAPAQAAAAGAAPATQPSAFGPGGQFTASPTMAMPNHPPAYPPAQAPRVRALLQPLETL